MTAADDQRRQQLMQAEIEVVKGTDEAVRFVEAAACFIGGGFHPDTPFGDYVDRDGRNVFTADEVRLLDDGLQIATDAINADDNIAVDVYEICMAAVERVEQVVHQEVRR